MKVQQINVHLSLSYESIIFHHYYLPICLYSLEVTYFVNDPSIFYLFGLIAFISLILYLVQFVVYTKEYLTRVKKNSNCMY